MAVNGGVSCWVVALWLAALVPAQEPIVLPPPSETVTAEPGWLAPGILPSSLTVPVEVRPFMPTGPVKGDIFFGLNGAQGNSEFLNIRAGFHTKREGEKADWKFDTLYNRASVGSVLTQNQFLGEGRIDFKLGDSPWRLYAFSQAWYDDFQAWDWRLVFNLGVGYQFVKNERTSWLGRIGPGIAREIGGPRNDLVPELNLGTDFEHKIDDRQKLVLAMDVFPSLKDLEDYRANGQITWEFLVDKVRNINLRVGVLDRYQSMPNGRERNDLNYFVDVVWKF